MTASMGGAGHGKYAMGGSRRSRQRVSGGRAQPDDGEVSTHRIAGRPDEVLDWLATVAQPFRAVYEAAQHHLTAWLVTATSGDSGFDEFQPEFAKWRNLSE